MLKLLSAILFTALSQGLLATGQYKALSDEDQKRGYLTGKYSTPQSQLEKLIKLQNKGTGESTRRGQLVFERPAAIRSKAALIRQQFVECYCPGKESLLIGFVMGRAANSQAEEDIIAHLKHAIPDLKIEGKRKTKPQSPSHRKRARHH